MRSFRTGLGGGRSAVLERVEGSYGWSVLQLLGLDWDSETTVITRSTDLEFQAGHCSEK